MMYDGHNNNRPKGWNLERQPFLLETNIPGIFAAGDVQFRFTKETGIWSRRGVYCCPVRPSIPQESVM